MSSLIELWIKIFTVLSAITGFCILHWKWWAKKALNKWYIHYKANRNQWRNSISEIQKKIIEKLVGIEKQVYPNGGGSILDISMKILDNQEVLKDEVSQTMYLDSAPITKTDINGECTFANLAYLKTFGFSSFEEVKGMGNYRSVHPEDRERVKREFADAFKTGDMLISDYRKINIATGEQFNVTSVARMVRDLKKERVAIIKSIHIKTKK